MTPVLAPRAFKLSVFQIVFILISTLLLLSVGANIYLNQRLGEVQRLKILAESSTKAPIIEYVPGKSIIHVVTNFLKPDTVIFTYTNKGKPEISMGGKLVSFQEVIADDNCYHTNDLITNSSGNTLELSLITPYSQREWKLKIEAQDVPWLLAGGDYMLSQSIDAFVYYRLWNLPLYVGPRVGYCVPTQKVDLGIGAVYEFRK